MVGGTRQLGLLLLLLSLQLDERGTRSRGVECEGRAAARISRGLASSASFNLHRIKLQNSLKPYIPSLSFPSPSRRSSTALHPTPASQQLLPLPALPRQSPTAMSSSPREVVVLETNMGNIAFELYTEHAPKTCRNFKELARKGYYSGGSQ